METHALHIISTLKTFLAPKALKGRHDTKVKI